jgi:hypothetical protein
MIIVPDFIVWAYLITASTPRTNEVRSSRIMTSDGYKTGKQDLMIVRLATDPGPHPTEIVVVSAAEGTLSIGGLSIKDSEQKLYCCKD